MTTRRYSRLATVEERKNVKNAYKYVVWSIIAIIFLIFLGIPTLVRFAGFIGDIAKSDKPVEVNDMTPPAPPQFDEIPEYTNKEILEIIGQSENSAIIKIRANNDDSEVVANSDGRFSFTFNLNKGENTIDATATDLSGNQSTQTQTFRISYDNEDPELTIESPADGSSFFGSGQRQLSIKGTVDENVDLRINDRFVSLKDDNSFTFATTLSEGENKFEVKAVDPAGNESSSSLTVTFSL
ncbi:MAG: Ig-like domain-containing protein [Microgenomates group bacterium]